MGGLHAGGARRLWVLRLRLVRGVGERWPAVVARALAGAWKQVGGISGGCHAGIANTHGTRLHTPGSA